MTYYVFMGYDPSEHAAYATAKYSLETLSSVPVKVIPIEHMDLRQQGLFTREWTIRADGQTMCNVDNKPFSTQFSHSRFLVPELWRNTPDPDKKDLVMFVDCDWLFFGDIGDIFRKIEKEQKVNDNENPLYCVHHDYVPTVTKKMHGVEQTKYNFKLWSSMMVFNMAHEDCQNLSADVVNTWDGRALHTFEWLDNVHNIGEIPQEWNFIPGHSEKHCKEIKGLHFTTGGPWHKGFERCKYANLWHEVYKDYLMSKIRNVTMDTEEILKGD